MTVLFAIIPAVAGIIITTAVILIVANIIKNASAQNNNLNFNPGTNDPLTMAHQNSVMMHHQAHNDAMHLHNVAHNSAIDFAQHTSMHNHGMF